MNGYDVPRIFDRNENDVLDVEEGQWVAIGGVDTSTQLPLTSPLTAPAGATAISPLTTLMAALINRHGFSLEEAGQRVREAFELPEVDLTHFDPIAGTVGGDPNAPDVVLAADKLHDTVAQTARLVAALPNAPPLSFVADLVVSDIAAKITQPQSGLNLSNTYVVQSVIEGALAETGLLLDSDVLEDAAAVIAAGNEQLDAISVSGDVAFLTAVVKIQRVAQGDAAAALAAAATDPTAMAGVLAAYTGDALQYRIDAAEPGNVVPPILVISDTTGVETDDGQVAYDFTVDLLNPSVSTVSVHYQTLDESAKVAEGDYDATSGTLTWEPGDTTPQTIRVLVAGDVVLEPDELFHVELDDAVGAAIWRSLAVGTIMNDDAIVYNAPSEDGPNGFKLWVEGKRLTLLRNDKVVLDGDFSQLVPISILGSPIEPNSLTIELRGTDEARLTDIHFTGGGLTEDALQVLDDICSTVVYTVTSENSGVFNVDGSVISYSGVESVSDRWAPEIVGLPTSSPEGTEIGLQTSVPDPARADIYTYHWFVTKDEAEYTTGSGADFTFTPADEGFYVVRLTTSADGAATAAVEQTLLIENVAPECDAGTDETLWPEVLGKFTRSGITFADPGTDFWSGTVNYGDGIVRDLTIDQQQMTFDLNHTYTSSGTYTVTVTIQDDDGGIGTDTFQVEVILAEVEFAQAAFVDLEDVGTSLVVQLQRTPLGTMVTSEVEVAITGGTAIAGVDYDASAFPLLVTFEPGVDVVSVTLPIMADNLVELDESITFSVSSVSNALITSQDTATLTIQNDDAAEFAVNSVSGGEDDGPLTFTVALSNPVDVATSVVVSTSDGGAVVGDSDYTAVEGLLLSFDAGVTTQTFTVAPLLDRKVELDETFNASLGNVENAGRSVTASSDFGIGTITNDDNATISIDDVTLQEEDGGITAFTFIVSMDYPASRDITVVVNTNGVTADGGGADFADIVNRTYTIAAGTLSTLVTVDVTAEALVEFDETFEVNLTDARFDGNTDPTRVVIGDPQGIGTIVNDDAATLSGAVICDDNLNGNRDANEHGVAGVAVTLESSDGQGVLRSAVTAVDGTFQFSNVGPGTYRMVETQPAGYFDLDLDSAPLGTAVNGPLADLVVGIVVNEVAPDQQGFLFAEDIAVDLGDLVNGGNGDGFALLGLTDTVVKLEDAVVNGDVGIGPAEGHGDRRGRWHRDGGNTELGDFEDNNSIDGDVFIDPSATFDDIDLEDITGDLITTDMSEPIEDAVIASQRAASLTPTQVLGDITPGCGEPNLTINGNGAINVIQVDDVRLHDGQTLILSGGPNDVFIINVLGKLDMDDNASIVLDGVLAQHVLWNFPEHDPGGCGHDSDGGTDVKGDKDVVLYGTVLAPHDSVTWNGTINGALIAGGKKLKMEGRGDGDHDDDDDDDGLDCGGVATINYIPWAFAKPDELPTPPSPGISGVVYEDSNGNGVYDPTDLGVAGVTIELRDAATDALMASAVTDLDGRYHFDDPGDGAYKLVEAQPAELLDGAETVGSNGGTVDNTTDSNLIADIVFSSGDVASGYDFGEVMPGGLSGFVWQDSNQDGCINFNEKAIEAAIVNLTGVDDRGAAVSRSTTTDAQGVYTFPGLRPGEYTLNEVQPAGFADGVDRAGTLGGLVDNLPGADQISQIQVGSRLYGTNYNFGEQAETSGEVQAGQTATIGFWTSRDGKKLIGQLNGGKNSELLGDYLAATYPNLFGHLAGKSNEKVSSEYNKLFKSKISKKTSSTDAKKLEVEVMALALATYVTDANLVSLQYDHYAVDRIARDIAGNVLVDVLLVTKVESYGFMVNDGGVGIATYDVGTLIGDAYSEADVRAAFNLGAADSTVLRISSILRATNDLTSAEGLLYDLLGNGLDSLERMLRDIANEVYTDINESGSI